MIRELLNTLYVLTDGAHVRLDGDTLRVLVDGEKRLQVPLHHLGAVMLFGEATTISAPALHRCAADGRAVALFDRGGRFKARVVGPTCGNVLLRAAQYEAHRDPARAAGIARCIVAGKVRNQRANLARAARDAADKRPGDAALLRSAAESLGGLLPGLAAVDDLDALRGVEGQASAVYFDAFGAMIAAPPSDFSFRTRTRRPPRDRVNALLSFLYALLASDCTAACEGVGLDPEFGLLHCLRPGRPSLALDLMEEFRPALADRLALTLINRRQLRPEHFDTRRPAGEADGDQEGAGESVSLTEDGRKLVLSAYQERKQEPALHPLLKDKAPAGLLPHLQARLLARHLRGDLAHYVPFSA